MKLIYAPKVVKQLKRIGVKDLPKIHRKLQSLKSDPRIGKSLEGEYKGNYALRAWPLRIIYSFHPDTQTIEIKAIDYRGSVYKN